MASDEADHEHEEPKEGKGDKAEHGGKPTPKKGSGMGGWIKGHPGISALIGILGIAITIYLYERNKNAAASTAATTTPATTSDTGSSTPGSYGSYGGGGGWSGNGGSGGLAGGGSPGQVTGTGGSGTTGGTTPNQTYSPPPSSPDNPGGPQQGPAPVTSIIPANYTPPTAPITPGGPSTGLSVGSYTNLPGQPGNTLPANAPQVSVPVINGITANIPYTGAAPNGQVQTDLGQTVLANLVASNTVGGQTAYNLLPTTAPSGTISQQDVNEARSSVAAGAGSAAPGPSSQVNLTNPTPAAPKTSSSQPGATVKTSTKTPASQSAVNIPNLF